MSKRKLAYFIKHNTVFKFLYVFLGSLCLRVIGVFVKTDDKLVLFVANVGKNYSGSPYEIYDYMQRHEEYSKYRCVWAFSNLERFQSLNIEKVQFDTLSYFITALKAHYWVTDVNIERSLNFKKRKTIYLNTWHGVAIKKIGNDDPNSGKYNYSKINYVCVSGEHDKKVYRSALKASEKSFLECGMPRNDSLFLATENQRTDIRKKLNIHANDCVILYAPTWRDSVNNGKSFDIRIPADFKHWEETLGKKYKLFFRAHDRTTQVMDIEFNDFIYDYSNYESLNELLVACDILITDYSSVVFDYSILGKPALCFAYDYEEYLATRGTYIDLNQVYPSGILKTEEEVLHAILNMNVESEILQTKAICRNFMEYSKGNAAQVCAEMLFK